MNSHLKHAAALIAEGMALMDRDPDTAAAKLSDARSLVLLADNIVLRLRLGEFGEE